MSSPGSTAVSLAGATVLALLAPVTVPSMFISFNFGMQYTRDASVPSVTKTELTPTTFAGKSFLLVGGTKGIGAGAAKALSRGGAEEIVIVGRSASAEMTSLPHVKFVTADASSIKECEDLVANRLKDMKFDVVLFTTGIITRNKLTKTSDGIEEDLEISYLSRFFIAQELIRQDRLKPQARIFVIGFPGVAGKINNIDDINYEKKSTWYRQWKAHINTVVANEALVHELKRRYGDSYEFMGLNPGMLPTGIRDNMHGGKSSPFGRVLEFYISLVAGDVNKYATNTLAPLFAMEPETAKTYNGVMFNHKRVAIKTVGMAKNAGAREKIWNQSVGLVRKVLPSWSPPVA